ncbi:MAG TPA: HD domain-containing protein [Rugosimonospora sp.]|nr:HD domain-containing protein [Rugosimonospora sp.]
MESSVLRTMPLHAITEVHGERGLRARFALEIADLPEPEREQLERALALAGELHRDDRRVREPYVNHLLRVAIRIIHYYRVRDPDVLAAALLHDAVEDHADELGGGTEAGLATLASRFNPRVAALVGAVTNPAYDPERDAHEQYREHVASSLAGDPWARVIKVSDFTDNGVGVIHTTGPKVRGAAAKYAPLVPILRELVALPDTPLQDEVRQHIFDQLDLADERFRAILGTGSAQGK